MIALITGASSGLGRQMAIGLAKRGFNLVIVARRKQRLYELKKELMEAYGVKVKVIAKDLSKAEECIALYNEVEKANIDIVINNAGFGVFGAFDETPLEDELKMINVNITAVHILTKLFLQKFKKRNSGYILNVASLAAFMAGPLFSSYYASKNYVLQLTKAIYEELRMEKSNVYIGAFCPGPVRTEFNEISGAEFAVRGMDEGTAAEYALEKMFDGELIIVPTMGSKFLAAASRFVPTKLFLAATGKVQKGRLNDGAQKSKDDVTIELITDEGKTLPLTEEEISALTKSENEDSE